MKISVVMATRGRLDWDRHLDSLLNQTVRPDQIVVIFDRQTSVLERQNFHQKWPVVDFLFNDRNIGLTCSLNRGLRLAKGDYIFRADDDDFNRKDRIEKQLDCFVETGADIIGSWATGNLQNSKNATYLIKCPSEDDYLKAGLLRRNILIHPSIAFRKSCITALGGYDENFEFAQDYALYLLAIREEYKFATVPEPLIDRFYGEESITVQHRHRQLFYSCVARLLHEAKTGGRIGLLKIIWRYGCLAIIPRWLRDCRRSVFLLIGRGA